MKANEEKETVEGEVVVPAKSCQGKDEMNLAEFPLCAIADRTDPDQNAASRLV